MLTLEDSVVQELKHTHSRIRGDGNHIMSDQDSGPSADHLHAKMSSNGNHSRVQFDENGLVVPRKLDNPLLKSKEHQHLHHEIRWNEKMKIDVLKNGKSELEKAMEKRIQRCKEKERLMEREASKTPFEKVLEERAKRLEKIEAQSKDHSDHGGHSSEDSGHCSPEPESEFLKIHAQLKARSTSSSHGMH